MLRPTALALLLAISACAPAPQTARNLVLITMDTTRPDRLGCYGSTAVSTPNIDAVAAGGTVFERAFAVAPITAPSHASILSGTFPPFHQVRDNDLFPVPRDLPWLPAILQARGYRTAAMVAAFPLRAGLGFGRGFDYYGDHLEAPAGSLVITNVHSLGVANRPGDRVSAEFLLWLDANAGSGPFFAWLHFYDPHQPYEPPAGYADLYAHQPYDGEVAFMDECIGTVLRALTERGIADHTGLVVLADHGEGLMEHGELTHAMLAYSSTLQVPLIVRLPWLESQTPRVSAMVSASDVMPTVLSALGIDPDSLDLPIQARSLLPLITGDEAAAGGATSSRELYFETFYPYHHYRWSPLSGFMTGDGRKLIHGPYDELYDLTVDPGESSDLPDGEARAAMAARLVALTDELRHERPETGRRLPSRQELEQLRALGYVGSEAGDDAEALVELTTLAHPRERMGEFLRYNEILSLAHQNRVAEALERAMAMTAADPHNKDARFMVASYSYRLGRVEAADRLYAELVRDFSDRDVAFQAGVHFLGRRDYARARPCFEVLVTADPGDFEALTRLGDVAAAEGDQVDARSHYERALAIAPDYREALLGLAVALDREGSASAAEQFAKVAAKFPFDPQVSFDYGVYLVRRGRAPEAVEYFRRSAAVSRGRLHATAQLALASLYRQQGALDEARASLREIVLRTDDPELLERAEAALVELGTD